MSAPLPAVDHRAAIVTSDADRAVTVRGFVGAGAASDELVLLVVRERALPTVADMVADRLDRVVMAPAERLFPGSSSAMFALYDDLTQQALAVGYSGMRIVGEPVWYADGAAADWCDFEHAANWLFDGWPLAALCLLDARVPPVRREVFLRAHPRDAAGGPNPTFHPA